MPFRQGKQDFRTNMMTFIKAYCTSSVPNLLIDILLQKKG